MCAPQPAAFTITRSAPANASAFRRARRRAVPSLPLWAGRAPQHCCARGIVTVQPLRASTRALARFTSRNHRSCTQPVSRATEPRRSTPSGGSVTAGIRRNRSLGRGVMARTRFGRNGVTSGWKKAAVQSSFLCASITSSPRRRACRWLQGRSASVSVRACSIIRPNGTCEGQTSSHARQTRQRSVNSRNRSSTAAAPSATARIAAIRPRGDADSSPVSR